ncbi:hypothetical protein [Streptomyces sp. ODS28]|uniref:hypothetical protein n=1 Tax=Streptomyces sp. ODS28 TaxID=3136688 RepID=UPI0031F16729
MATVHMYQLKTAAALDPQYAQGSVTHKNAVLLVERALAAEGLLDPSWVDGSFGTKTVQAYAAWQRALGYSGGEADGKPGYKSAAELGRQHGFRVVND